MLSQAELDYFVAAALARWSAAGLTAEQVALIGTTGFAVANMPGMYLGSFAPGQITLDDNAAGYGWYLDPTPLDDVEFGTVWSPTRLIAGTAGAPAGHIDLLTTLMHEMGHQLGLGDSYSLDDRDELMYGYLVTGERRLPGEGEADGATPGSVASEEFLVGPINIGTIPVGQTVTIQWDATIDAQSNALIANLSNQGTVTGNQPGAFSVNTDGDGGTAGIQATITVLDSLSLGNQVFWDKDRQRRIRRRRCRHRRRHAQPVRRCQQRQRARQSGKSDRDDDDGGRRPLQLRRHRARPLHRAGGCGQFHRPGRRAQVPADLADHHAGADRPG